MVNFIDAINLLLCVSNFGTMMVNNGLADVVFYLVSGASNTIANTIRTALKFIK